MAKGPWNTGTWDDAEWDSLPVTSTSATGGVGDLGHSRSVALLGAAATGDVGSVSDGITDSLVGVSASADVGTLTPVIQPLVDTHDGDQGKKRKKRWDEEREAREGRKRELIDVYEQLVEGKPAVAAAIVKPYVQKATPRAVEPSIDWNKLIGDVERVQALYREHQEMDDEDVLLLL